VYGEAPEAQAGRRPPEEDRKPSFQITLHQLERWDLMMQRDDGERAARDPEDPPPRAACFGVEELIEALTEALEDILELNRQQARELIEGDYEDIPIPA
jgi:hypothetical protein